MSTNARATLETARFFLEEAKTVQFPDTKALKNNLVAAIVFGRSVLNVLENEYEASPNFEDWFKKKNQSLWTNKLVKFIVDSCNFILKEGNLEVKGTFTVALQSYARVAASVSVKVIRAKPWYKRSPRTIIRDLLFRIREFRRRRNESKHADRSIGSQHGGQPVFTQRFYFDDADWNIRPAQEIVQEFLDEMDKLLVEIETNFKLSP